MQVAEMKLGDLTGKTAVDILKSMDVSKTNALDVDAVDAATTRTTIWRLHQDTEMKFKTAKTPTGILVWRIK